MGRFGGLGLFSCLALATAFAQAPQINLVKVSGGFSQPTQVTNAGDGSGRLFVVEQPGRIQIIRNGSAATAPFLDIAARVSCCGERGLLSVAFPPGYSTKNYFYVDYTATNGDLTVSRFRTTPDPDVADPGSETVLLTVNHEQFANHNGGQLRFGPDDYLYIGTGDGGGGGDTLGNGQNTNSLLAKLLRIDVESGVTPYAIPPTNPFVGRSGYRPEIWAYGLRNPWRFSFDRATGDLYIGDVGQDRYEEIDYQPAGGPGGENYGWNIMEGLHCYQQPACSETGLTLPVSEYPHTGGNCSITGGFVYRGSQAPALQGTYLYADYCTGTVWGLTRSGAAWNSTQLLNTRLNISSFGEDEAGEVYLVDNSGGGVYRVEGAGLSVVNAASLEPGLSPGAIATIFGQNLTSVAGIVEAGPGALPRELSGTSVLVNGAAAPLFSVVNDNGAERVNFQVPYEIAPGSQATVVVVNNGAESAPVQVDVQAAQPGVFTTDGAHAAALHAAGYVLLTESSPAAPGEIVLLYATGLGAVDNPPGTGNPAPDTPLSRTLAQPQVTIGGLPAAVLFSGLAPRFAGLYQLNVEVPAAVASGDQDVVVAIGGQTSKTVKIAVSR